MKIVSSSLAVILVFESRKNLQGIIEHLQGMLEWAEKDNVEPPYLYATFEDTVDRAKVLLWIDELKEQFRSNKK